MEEIRVHRDAGFPRYTLYAHDGEMHISETAVTLVPKGLLAKINKGSTGTKTVRLSAITSVQIKKPGFTSGFIQLSFSGESAKRGGAFKAVQDENALTISGTDQYEDALRAKALIEHYQAHRDTPSTPPATKQAPSHADQIRSLAGLRDDGLLTEEEFEAKRKEILARM